MALKFLVLVVFAFFVIQESKCQYSGESQQQIVWAPLVTSGVDGTQSQEDYYAPEETSSREERRKHKRGLGSMFNPSYSHLVQPHPKASDLTHRTPGPDVFMGPRGKKSFFPAWYTSSRRFYPRKKMYIQRPKQSVVDESVER